LTDPYTQFAFTTDYACDPSPYQIFDEQTCNSIRSKIPTCQRLQKYCYDSPSRFTCVPASLYCWSNIVGPIQNSGLNPYDIRRPCDRNGGDGPLCYKEMLWIEIYLNRPEVKKALGVPKELQFESCNMRVNQAFMLQGDGMHNSAELLSPLLEDGIRVLVYAGEFDFMCQFMGNKAWVLALDSIFKDELNKAKDKVWRTLESDTKAGFVRQAGSGAGNFTFIKILQSGHMAPADQPENLLDMLDRWLANVPLTAN